MHNSASFGVGMQTLWLRFAMKLGASSQKITHRSCTAQCPPVVLLLLTLTSYRIHSVFVLRLFNDPVAMLIFYAAVVAMMRDQWLVGCILYRYTSNAVPPLDSYHGDRPSRVPAAWRCLLR